MDPTQPDMDALTRAIMGGGPLPSFHEAPQSTLPAFMPSAPQSQQSLPEWKASIADQIRGQFQQYMQGANQLRDAMTPKTAGDVGEMALYSTPVVGEALSAKDAYNNLASGDYRNATLSALGVLPFMGGVIKAYHGSPHNFERFDMSKIGTGEGAQAYGHGLYFAEDPGVSESYRRALSERADAPRSMLVDAQGNRLDVSDVPGDLTFFGGDYGEASHERLKQFAQQNLERAQNVRNAQLREAQTKRAQSAVDWLNQNPGSQFVWNPEAGRMYEVNINADPEHFLDWDKPLNEQWDRLKEPLQKVAPDYANYLEANPSERGRSAGVLIDAVRQNVGPQTFSNALHDAGIPGIRYLDQGSRSAGEGSRNYVVFSDDLVSIVRKYGIPGAIGLGLISPEVGRQLQEQGM